MSRFLWWLLVFNLPTLVVVADGGMPDPAYLSVREGLPQGFIKSIVQDRQGFIWMATRDGLCRYDGLRFQIYTHDAQQPRSLSFSSLYELRLDNRNKLWVRSETNDVDLFDPVTEQCRRVSSTPAFRQALGRDVVVSIHPDRSGNVWVATQTNGFFRLNGNGTISHRFWPMQGDTVQRFIRTILVDQQGRLWLACRDGLFRYDPAYGQFTGYRTAQGLPDNHVVTMHQRRNGELMLGFSGRFALFDPGRGTASRVIPVPGDPAQVPLFAIDQQGQDYVNQSRYTDRQGLIPTPADPKLATFPIQCLLVDRSNVLWIGTGGDGVIKCDLNPYPFRALPYTTNFQTDWLTQQAGVPISAVPADIRQQGPFSIRSQYDRRGVLWISSATTHPYWYDPASQLFKAVSPKGIEARWLTNGLLRLPVLATGPQGELWGLLGPNGQAVVRHNPDKQTFTTFPLPLPADHPYTIQAMVVDGGRIYLATQNHGLLRADLSTQRLLRWYTEGEAGQFLPNNTLLCLAQDRTQYNHLWIGTYGGGLCRLDKLTGQVMPFTTAQGLPNNVIYAIRQDNDGFLWLSTNRGLCRFDSRTFEVRNYTTDDGLPNDEFNRFHDVALPDGRLIFGGVGGYTIFNPRRIGADPFKPAVALTALRINNQLVSTNTPDSPLQQDINETSKIVLNHQQNFLSLDFAALQFNKAGKNRYRYKLIGLDDDWVYPASQATATYTNLPPATYTFIVNASNTSGIWSPYSHQITIVIEPPLWATWWAYVGYVLLLLGAILLFLRVRINRIRLRSRMELREQESTQLKHLDEVKTRFFANITHELRTPLTLILTPLDELLTDTTDPQQSNRLTLIRRNARQLLRLINELLDLAKIDAGSMPHTPAPGNLPEFIERTAQVFSEEARRKQVLLTVDTHVKQPHYWFDADKLEKILSNLLSNALKFTSETGTISVSVSTSGKEAGSTSGNLLRLVVQDSGVGIDPQKLPYIFNRFYQADPITDGVSVGSGVGLALVKELVEVMQGSISVKSMPQAGTIFTIDLPCRPVHGQEIAVQTTVDPAVTSDESSGTGSEKARLLLVEDNDDIAQLLMDILGDEWQITRVNNGRTGVDAALTTDPDLIVSDVLMPEMNGYDLCRTLKSNPVTSHIPIILLTAKAAVDSRIEGLSAGADDYIAKPFQANELRGRLRNRLAQQARIRRHYRSQLIREGHLPVVGAAPEDEFMNQIYTVLESRMDDSTFGVEPLAAEIGMSRMHLNRKVKAMTGMTPNELIRVVRLNRAAQLLLTGVSISEAADRAGFDTAAYFSRVFKEHYQLTPSEYVVKNRQVPV